MNLARAMILSLLLGLAGCGSNSPKEAVGKLACESFLIYDLCIHDLTGDGVVDYMYFDDTKEIFMYRQGMEAQVSAVMAMHRCAIPMTEPALKNSSELLYLEERGLGTEMVLKGKLVSNYLQVKSQIDACYYQTASPKETKKSEETEESSGEEDFYTGEADF